MEETHNNFKLELTEGGLQGRMYLDGKEIHPHTIKLHVKAYKVATLELTFTPRSMEVWGDIDIVEGKIINIEEKRKLG